MRKCVVCYGEDIEVSEVQEELRMASGIVCVPSRIPVCQTCGERYYDRRTMRFLEDVEQKLREGQADLQIVGQVLLYGWPERTPSFLRQTSAHGSARRV